MSQETSAILRALLYQSLSADDVEDVRAAIKAMCTKDEIAAVTQEFEENRTRKETKKTNA
jgi:uncharacterized protein YerC